MTGVQAPGSISTKQARIAKLARQMTGTALHSLSHHMDMDWLREAHRRTRKDGAVGVDHNVSVRAANYVLALRSASIHPVLGVGLGNYSAIYREFPGTTVTPLLFAHSLILTLIPEIGLLGAMAFTLFFTLHIVKAYRRRPREESREIDFAFASGLGLLGMLVIASTSGCHLVTHFFYGKPDKGQQQNYAGNASG